MACAPKSGFDARRIVRIVEVRDTRDCVEVDDRLVPVPGSGDARPCDQCGRAHEIHVTVEVEGGAIFVVGASCARGSAFEPEIRRRVSSAKRRAELTRKLLKARVELARIVAVEAEVAALAVPPVIEDLDEIGRPTYVAGDARVYGLRGDSGGDPERIACAQSFWRDARRRERGVTRGRWEAEATVEELEKRLVQVETKEARGS